MFNYLYVFIWIHSLLSGFFIFFIPVFLWKLGFNLSQISLFISITWLSFSLSIYLWDKIRYFKDISLVIRISFLLEILLVWAWLFTDKVWVLYVLAILYWAYNCFFWLTQRILFLNEISHHNIWKKFWNIQIIAFILVKIWILVGSYLLEYYNFFYLWVMVLIINIIWIILFKKYNYSGINISNNKKQVRIKDIIKFKDKYNSKIIFIIDWPFLFFESFFWVISLFFITNESYTQLWYLTIFLALAFSVSFYSIKNKIDKVKWDTIYKISVILYALSWVFRWYITQIDNQTILYIVILIIAFFTSFFRLSFNKKFFHITKDTLWEKYIIIKSYYSQMAIFIIFWPLSFLIYNYETPYQVLFTLLYLSLWLISLIYLSYKSRQQKKM